MRRTPSTRPSGKPGRDRRLLRRGPLRRPRGDASGFTLLEVMIAMALLAIGVLGVAGAQIMALKFTRDSRIRAQAMFLAEQQIETIHAMSAVNVIALKTDPDYPDDPNNPIDPTPGDGDSNTFDRRWDIAEDDPEPDVLTITVEVDYTNSLGQSRTLSLQTMKAS